MLRIALFPCDGGPKHSKRDDEAGRKRTDEFPRQRWPRRCRWALQPGICIAKIAGAGVRPRTDLSSRDSGVARLPARGTSPRRRPTPKSKTDICASLAAVTEQIISAPRQRPKARQVGATKPAENELMNFRGSGRRPPPPAGSRSLGAVQTLTKAPTGSSSAGGRLKLHRIRGNHSPAGNAQRRGTISGPGRRRRRSRGRRRPG